MDRRFFFLAAASGVSLVLAGAPAQAAPQTYGSVGAGGYDVVNYHTARSAKPGSSKFSTSYKGAKWYFLNAENLAAFKASPGRYAPAFGGYCAYAVSNGVLAAGDPKRWAVVGGKLYLNLNARAQSNWNEDRAGHIASGNKNWPKVLN